MRKGEETGVVVGEATDEWGWVIKLRAVYDPVARQYVGEGTLGDPPEALRVPAIDGEVTP
jgi:hypothetical protein